MGKFVRKGIIVLMVASMVIGTSTIALAQEEAPGKQIPRFKGWGMETVMEFLDVSKGEVISTLRTGGTLAELAAENGSSGDELVGALVAVVDSWLQQAVADERITEEEAAEKLAEATDRITNAVFNTHDGPDRNANHRRGAAMDVVMETLDVNRGQVTSTLRTGGTLSELAEENGSSGEELVGALVAAVDTHLQEAVDAGHITEEEAAERLADAEVRIADFVFSTHDGPRS